MSVDVDGLLKAEIHCHIEGAAHPELVQRLARKHGLDVSDAIENNRYVWSDFTSFLNCYDNASRVFREPEDYRLLTYDCYSRMAEQKAIYGEVFASPDHAAELGIGYVDLIGSMAAGIEDARAEFGIEGRIIVTCVRHLGPESAEAVADQMVSNPHPAVTGFGMGGDERAFDIEDFAPAFAIASDAGLGITSHAGEFTGAKTVAESVEILGATRIGHGVRSIEDSGVVDLLVEQEVVLEVCPGSNVALKVYPSMADHPLRKLWDAGVRLCLNSDDPPYFHTSLTDEYRHGAESFAFSEGELNLTTQIALEAAFVDEQTRQRLLNRLAKGV